MMDTLEWEAEQRLTAAEKKLRLEELKLDDFNITRADDIADAEAAVEAAKAAVDTAMVNKENINPAQGTGNTGGEGWNEEEEEEEEEDPAAEEEEEQPAAEEEDPPGAEDDDEDEEDEEEAMRKEREKLAFRTMVGRCKARP